MATEVAVDLVEQLVEGGDCFVGKSNELVHELFGKLGDGFGTGKEVEEEGVVCGHSTRLLLDWLDRTGGFTWALQKLPSKLIR